VAAAPRVRAVVLAAALFLLLLAPASWAVDTLGHATGGTFPAGGPASASMGGPGGGPGGFSRGGRGGFGGGPPGLSQGGGAGSTQGGPGAQGGFAPPGGPGSQGGLGSTNSGVPNSPNSGGFAGGGGGGPFGSDASSIAAIVKYVNAHGGGTIGVSSQQGAASSIIQSGAKVAGLGGFSGRESEVSVKWLAEQVRAGHIRWVLADGSGGPGFGQDSRVGSSKVMAAVEQTCTRVTVSGTTLYDCAGHAGALAALSSN
jgi:hypothetical protein